MEEDESSHEYTTFKDISSTEKNEQRREQYEETIINIFIYTADVYVPLSVLIVLFFLKNKLLYRY